jgi:hypothetical protein
MPTKDPEKQRAYHRKWSIANKEWWEIRRKRNRDILRAAKAKPCADCHAGRTFKRFGSVLSEGVALQTPKN